MEATGDSAPTHAGAWADAALAGRVQATRERIEAAARRAGRSPEEILLVAVTKTLAAERLVGAALLGLTVFGENRVQEAHEKRERLAEIASADGVAARALLHVRWELIGHLQSNKAQRALSLFERIQSVDSVRLAEALNQRSLALGQRTPVLLEVNVGAEASKSGFTVDDVVESARTITALPGLRAEGLMTVAPITPEPEGARPYFRRLRELRDQLRVVAPVDGGWRELSMGMTDDFEVAIEEGATLVRIGRGLFGERPPLRSADDAAVGA